MLMERCKPHMPFGEFTVLLPGHRADDRNAAALLYGFPDHRLVPAGRYIVQNDPADIYFGIICPASQYNGPDRAGGLGAIHNKKDRRFEQFCQSCRVVAPRFVNAVKEAPVALDQCRINAPGMLLKRAKDALPLHHEEVEIIARPSRRLAKPSRVDKIGSLFKDRHLPALPAPRCGDADRDGCLAQSPSCG
jgi:hypothetical protein